MEIEIWADVIGGNGFYQVSTFGRVKSVARKNVKTDKIIKPNTQRWGYLIVHLRLGEVRANGRKKSTVFKLHRLVAMTFIPNPDNKKYVNHKDGDKGNNSVANLEWCSASENIGHSYDVLKRRPTNLGRFGGEHNQAKKVVQVSLEGDIIRVWDSLSDVERDKGIKTSLISNAIKRGWICQGFYWKAIIGEDSYYKNLFGEKVA